MAKSKKGRTARPKSSQADRKLRRKANESAHDQFAALGSFIQRFEFIITVLRNHCRDILMGGQHGISITESSVIHVHWKLCSLAFHHEVMTARPLVEIWRALVIEQCAALMSLSKLSTAGQAVVGHVTTDIVNMIGDVISTRNRLIHASWAIGRWFPDDDLEKILAEKYTVGKEGLRRRIDLPQSFSHLMKLNKDVDRVAEKLGRFIQFYHYKPNLLESVYKKISGEWTFIPPTTPGAKQKSLRKKSQ